MNTLDHDILRAALGGRQDGTDYKPYLLARPARESDAPLSRVPGLIDEIRRERDELRLRIKTLEDTVTRMKRGYE